MAHVICFRSPELTLAHRRGAFESQKKGRILGAHPSTMHILRGAGQRMTIGSYHCFAFQLHYSGAEMFTAFCGLGNRFRKIHNHLIVVETSFLVGVRHC